MQSKGEAQKQAALSKKALAQKAARHEDVHRLLLSIDETGQVLGVGRSTVYELITSGELASIKLGSRRLVPVEACHALIAAKRAEA